MQNTLKLPYGELAIFPASGVVIPVQAERRGGEARKFAVRRILLPFDLSRASVCALRTVTNFAAKNGASVHLLHVVSPADNAKAEPRSSRADDRVAEAAGRHLKAWIKRIVQDRVQTFATIRIGEPVDLIVTRATASRADLIVMTSRACSGLKNELQRSSAERVSRLAPCPVLTIPEKCAGELAYSPDGIFSASWRTILMPMDFSAAAECALPFSSAIAAQTGAKLLLAHGSDADDMNASEVHARIRSWAEQTINTTAHCQTAVWPGGHSLFAILAEALRSEVNLIVLPTRAQRWAQRLRAGSITDGVLRQAPCPVLSINENVSIANE